MDHTHVLNMNCSTWFPAFKSDTRVLCPVSQEKLHWRQHAAPFTSAPAEPGTCRCNPTLLGPTLQVLPFRPTKKSSFPFNSDRICLALLFHVIWLYKFTCHPSRRHGGYGNQEYEKQRSEAPSLWVCFYPHPYTIRKHNPHLYSERKLKPISSCQDSAMPYP